MSAIDPAAVTANPDASTPSTTERPSSTDGGLLTSPWFWTTLFLVAFYQAIPHLPFSQEFMQRYFCGHPIEYAEMGLFVLGMSILGIKLFRLRRERQALAGDILPERGEIEKLNAIERAEHLEARIHSEPAIYRQTWWFQRILDACRHVQRTGRSAGLDDELKHFSDQGYNRLHDSYALLQTITWAIPIMGFLGTVMGVTISIANITPDQLDSSLNDVTGGLAVAFDTTALALSLSLVLVFSYFFVKRSEESIITQVEDLAAHQLSTVLNDPASAESSLVDAEAHAAQQLVKNTESLLHKHVELWDDSLNELRDRWSATLSERHSHLSESLVDGVALSLDEHRRLVDELQGKVLTAFDACSQMLVDSVDSADQRRYSQQEKFATGLQEMGQQLHAHLLEAQSGFERRQLALAESMSVQVGVWQDRLEGATNAIERQIETLTAQGDLLAQVVANEEHLVRLQDRLTSNLEAVRAAETFEETLHQLTAAVHMLTTRVRPQAA